MMNAIKVSNTPNPRESANFISKFFYWWIKELYKTAYEKVISLDNLHAPLKADKSTVLGDKLEKKWNEELNKAKIYERKPNLLKVICLTFQGEFFFIAFCHAFVELFLSIVMPILLGFFIRCFNPRTTTTFSEAITYATGLTIANSVKGTLGNHIIYHMLHLGGRIRIALCSLVYRKALRLGKTELCDTSPGKIVNLIGNDINRLQYILLHLNFIWSAPLIAVLSAYILYIHAGYASFIGIACLLILVPIQVYMGNLSAKYRQKAALKTDERVRLLSEIVSGVQVIKMCAWEKPFCALVKMARDSELRIISVSAYFRDIAFVFNLFTPRVVLYCSVASAFMLDEKLTLESIFVLISFYFTLSDAMVEGSRGLSDLTEALVSIRRIQYFLMLDEFSPNYLTFVKSTVNKTEDYNKNDNSDNSSKENWAIKIEQLTIKWNLSLPNNTLNNISLKFNKGKLYAAIGMVATGKSSLLSSILGEIKAIKGHVQIKGSLSYASQNAWIFGSTVRQNILFGEKFDEKRYQEVINVCCLGQDLGQLAYGDRTLVGEKGVILSGGQKARINLARAIYRQSDIYLLDDPLSAVDTHVGKHLFQKCIVNYLKGKTRILVTHQLQYLKKVDNIILLDKDKALHFESYHQLLDHYPEYRTLIIAEGADDAIEKGVTDSNKVEYECEEKFVIKDGKKESRKFDEVMDNSDLRNDSLLTKYYRSGSNLFLIFIMFAFFIAAQCFVGLNDLFIFAFIIDGGKSKNTLEEYDSHSLKILFYTYTSIVFLIFAIGAIRSLLFSTLCIRSSRSLHNSAFEALIRTNLNFFHVNPSGKILTRFSIDMFAVDEVLPVAMMEALQILIMAAGSILVTCLINPVLTAPSVIAVLACVWIWKLFYRTMSNIRHLDAMAQAPVFTYLNETLNGISTIRAYRSEKILKQEFDHLQDIHTSAWYYIITCRLAYGFCTKLIIYIFVLIITFVFVTFKSHFTGNGIGLAITQLIYMTVAVPYGAMMSAETANHMTAVNRFLEYKKLPKEDEEEIIKKKNNRDSSMRCINPSKQWPNKGYVEFKNVSMRYEDKGNVVLNNISFFIKAEEKVGIVGRTGAGKSSLISALFRLSQIEGTIIIDGIDVGSISLETLRRRISIIPQDPILFSGTLRRNLDPFNEFSDDDLWKALEQVELKKVISASVVGLDSQVMDRGSNYSAGQRQLVCLARAILRKNRILVLDEATANVDPQTDYLIQKTIRTKFASCTVLTVAHRLNTIIDSDKVIVLDDGCIIEFDHPYNLLRKKSSKFVALVKETGETMFQHLLEIAEQCFKGHN